MGFILHPAPFLGWAGAGVDLEVRFFMQECGAVDGTGFAGVRG
ncbi:hypothetical protein LU674_027835 [Pseudomonas alloputida]|jgi:hypothetical protein|uniref:Uncharacterized protein n=1 Tax=Pseudomonas alloputida TaxID=1940621 RepID=A0AAW7HTV8_9PSED|nr:MULTISPECIES: hypothetical protein [Pseudomonas]MDM3956105.1 hypothetical protein [Pseudomonas alloputida]WJR62732.1 hypothetical protein LU693_003640 [Pseudomonas alloputida]